MMLRSTSPSERFFSAEEYERRLTEVRQRMAETDVDILFSFHPENVNYLSGYQSIGYSSFLCLVVPSTGDLWLLVREMEKGCARYYSWVEDVETYADHEDPVEVLVKAASDRGWTSHRMGLELDAPYVGAKRVLELENSFNGADIVDASGTVEHVRRLKSSEEITYIRKACRTTEAGMFAGIEAIQSGVTENDIASAMFRGAVSAGSTYMSSQPIVTSGPRSGVAHTTFDNRTIASGDAVLLEIGGCVNRYSGGLMRTVVVGEVPAEVETMFEACLAGLEAAIDAITPGVEAGQVDAACTAVMKQAGYGNEFRKRTGYSVGISFPPDWGEGHILSLRHLDPTPLEPGMVFHIPPALRRFAEWGVGVSETVLVTDDGCEVLTHVPRKLFRVKG